jgi:hypothetical protein
VRPPETDAEVAAPESPPTDGGGAEERDAA